MTRHTNSSEFVFSIDEIPKPRHGRFEWPYFDRILPEIQNHEGYIEVISGGRIRLTDSETNTMVNNQ